MVKKTAFAMVTSLLLASCAGDPSTGPASAGAGPLSSLDEVCDGAVTARDVLARVANESDLTLRYRDRPGSTPLVIRTAYEGGALTCVPHVVGVGRMPDIEARVKVEVQMSLVTADGSFNESFVATLDGVGNAPTTWGSPTFHVGDLQGTWDPDLPGYQLITFDFHGFFDGPSTTGYLVKRGQQPGFAPSAWLPADWRY